MQHSIIKSGRIRRAGEWPTTEAVSNDPNTSAQSCGGKRVELLRIEGRVEGIQLTCGCGDVTVVRLEYNENTESPSS